MLPFWPIFLINLIGKRNQQCRRKNYFCLWDPSKYCSQKSQVLKKIVRAHVFMVPGRSQALSTSSATPEKTIKEWLPSFSKPSSLITPFTCQLCVYCQSNSIVKHTRSILFNLMQGKKCTFSNKAVMYSITRSFRVGSKKTEGLRSIELEKIL